VNTDLQHIQETLQNARTEIGKVVLGQSSVIDQCLMVILSGQHALLEGVPGIGKTLLVNAMAQALGCDFQRIQMTPDLMPSDIIGTSMFDMKEQTFHLVKGPVFTTFLLADEVNRAPAKTQSALLQAMQERSVAIDRDVHSLHEAFTVFATQNPVEHEGTYPLPEAQKDRFMLKIQVGYPEAAIESDLAKRFLTGTSPETSLTQQVIQPVLNPESLKAAKQTLQQISVSSDIVDYATQLVRATREDEHLLSGASPRATIALLMGARVQAVLEERDFVTPDDLKRLAHGAMDHRLILHPEFEIEGVSVHDVVAEILNQVPVPR